MTDNIADIARGLTEEQRRVLLEGTVRSELLITVHPGKLPSPLVSYWSFLSDRLKPLGIQVRAHLENKDG